MLGYCLYLLNVRLRPRYGESLRKRRWRIETALYLKNRRQCHRYEIPEYGKAPRDDLEAECNDAKCYRAAAATDSLYRALVQTDCLDCQLAL